MLDGIIDQINLLATTPSARKKKMAATPINALFITYRFCISKVVKKVYWQVICTDKPILYIQKLKDMNTSLPPLPYWKDALAPRLSKRQLEYHHDKHHAAYATNLARLIEDTPYQEQTLEQIIQHSDGPVFNNAAQLWNHTFYFAQFSQDPSPEPTGMLKEAIEMSFGSLGGMKEQFSEAAMSLFGSGWVWLVKEGKELMISPMSNGHTPIAEGRVPILTCDVWEHAYYIDYYNRRGDYLKAFWEIIDWRVIDSRFR